MKIKDVPENAVYKGVHNTYPGVHNAYSGVDNTYSGVQDIYPRVTSKNTVEKKNDEHKPTVAPGMRDFLEREASPEEIKKIVF